MVDVFFLQATHLQSLVNQLLGDKIGSRQLAARVLPAASTHMRVLGADEVVAGMLSLLRTVVLGEVGKGGGWPTAERVDGCVAAMYDQFMTKRGLRETERMKWLLKKRGATAAEAAQVKVWSNGNLFSVAKAFDTVRKNSASL
jgi:hypothetical protein